VFAQQINCTDEDAIEFDPDLFEVGPSGCRLKLVPNPGRIFQQTFQNDTGFIYDSNLAEIVPGILRQKNQTPVNSVFGARFTDTINGNWTRNNLSTTATAIGSPAIVDGKLATNGPGNGVHITNADIGLAGMRGMIEFKITPTYSGTPDVNYGAVHLGNPSSPTGADSFTLLHSASGGTWRITARDSSNVSQHSAQIVGSAWSPVAGTEYVVRIYWDLRAVMDGGFGYRIEINNVLHGSLASAFTRGNSATRLYVGSNPTYTPGRASFRHLHIYDVPPALGGALDYVVPAFKYAKNRVRPPAFIYTGNGTIQSVEVFTVTVVNGVRFGVAEMYVDVSDPENPVWAESVEVYEDASPPEDIQEHLPLLEVEGAGVAPYFIDFPDSNTQSSISLIYVELTGQIFSTDNPAFVSAEMTEADEVSAFLASINAPAGTAVKFSALVSGVEKSFQSGAWSASAGYATANTYAEFQAAFATLLASRETLQIKVYLHWESGINSPAVSLMSYLYSAYGVTPDEPARCLVYCYLNDVAGTLKDVPQQATLTVELLVPFQYAGRFIARYKRVFKFDADGYVETSPAFLSVADPTVKEGLVESATAGLSPYKFTLNYRDSDNKKIVQVLESKQVPNTDKKNLAEYL
jgi:hypothetical protein